MNKCPLCGSELTTEEIEEEVTRRVKKCKNCGFEEVSYTLPA